MRFAVFGVHLRRALRCPRFRLHQLFPDEVPLLEYQQPAPQQAHEGIVSHPAQQRRPRQADNSTRVPWPPPPPPSPTPISSSILIAGRIFPLGITAVAWRQSPQRQRRTSTFSMRISSPLRSWRGSRCVMQAVHCDAVHSIKKFDGVVDRIADWGAHNTALMARLAAEWPKRPNWRISAS